MSTQSTTSRKREWLDDSIESSSKKSRCDISIGTNNRDLSENNTTPSIINNNELQTPPLALHLERVGSSSSNSSYFNAEPDYTMYFQETSLRTGISSITTASPDTTATTSSTQSFNTIDPTAITEAFFLSPKPTVAFDGQVDSIPPTPPETGPSEYWPSSTVEPQPQRQIHQQLSPPPQHTPEQARPRKSFRMGYSASCLKCQSKVPGHFSHFQ